MISKKKKKKKTVKNRMMKNVYMIMYIILIYINVIFMKYINKNKKKYIKSIENLRIVLIINHSFQNLEVIRAKTGK